MYMGQYMDIFSGPGYAEASKSSTDAGEWSEHIPSPMVVLGSSGHQN